MRGWLCTGWRTKGPTKDLPSARIDLPPMVCHYPASMFMPELKFGAAASVLEVWPCPFPMPEAALYAGDRAIPARQIWTPHFGRR